jgi:hypothetical protein
MQWHCRRRLRTPALIVLAWILCALGPAAMARGAPNPDEMPPPPRDPDETPYMKAPAGQPSQTPEARLKRPYSPRKRFQITVLPVYAAFNLDFIGRPRETIRGFGAALEVDLQLYDFLWLRAQGSHTMHPVEDEFVQESDGDPAVQVARSGMIMGSNAGLSLVYAMDLGRFMPLIDAGVGAMFITTPEAIQDGQMGGACRNDGSCDMGLTCGSDQICRMGVVMEAHLGLGLDVLIRERLTVGAHVRYHALLREPAVFPVYLMGALRLALRF